MRTRKLIGAILDEFEIVLHLDVLISDAEVFQGSFEQAKTTGVVEAPHRIPNFKPDSGRAFRRETSAISTLTFPSCPQVRDSRSFSSVKVVIFGSTDFKNRTASLRSAFAGASRSVPISRPSSCHAFEQS